MKLEKDVKLKSQYVENNQFTKEIVLRKGTTFSVVVEGSNPKNGVLLFGRNEVDFVGRQIRETYNGNSSLKLLETW